MGFRLAPIRLMPSFWQCSAVALLCLLAALPMAAPVTDTDETGALGSLRDPMLPGRRQPSAQTSTPRGLDRALGAETSTGNKNLDLLLELQGKPGEELRQAAPRSAAAASAAASALAALRVKAAERPAQYDGKAKPAPQPFEGMGTLEGEARAARPTERRQWSGQLAGGGGGGAGYSDGSRGPGSSRDGYDDNLLRKLSREVIAFLREKRYWLLGALGGLVVIGAGLKAYSRRV